MYSFIGSYPHYHDATKNGAHVRRALALPATLENENRTYLQHLYVLCDVSRKVLCFPWVDKTHLHCRWGSVDWYPEELTETAVGGQNAILHSSGCKGFIEWSWMTSTVYPQFCLLTRIFANVWFVYPTISNTSAWQSAVGTGLPDKRYTQWQRWQKYTCIVQINADRHISIAVFSKNRPSPLSIFVCGLPRHSQCSLFHVHGMCFSMVCQVLRWRKLTKATALHRWRRFRLRHPASLKNLCRRPPTPPIIFGPSWNATCSCCAWAKKKQRTKTNQRVLKKWAAGLVVEGDACLLLTLMKFPFVSIPTSYIYISVICVFFYLTIFNHFEWICLRSWWVGENGEAAWDSSINQVPKHHRDCVLDGDLFLKLSLLFRTSLKKMSSWVLWG